MKISFFDDEPEIFPLQYGGKARTIVNLATEFAKLSEVEKVTILSRSIFSEEKEFEKDGVHYVALDDENTLQRIAAEMNEVDILNIHCCSFTFPFIKGKAKKFYFLHDVLIATADKGSHLDKSLGGNFDAIIAPSEFAKSVYNKYRKIISGQTECYVIPRHINNNLFYNIDKNLIYDDKETPDFLKRIVKIYDKIIFFPSRPIEEKGGIYLKNIITQLDKKINNYCIIGPFGNIVDLPEKCIDTGWIESDKLKYYYSISDLTLNLSILPESFSQICIESIYCKTPIVAFKYGNIPNFNKLTDSVILVDENIDSIIEGIIFGLEMKKNYSKMNKAKNIIESNFSKEKIIQQYLELYKKYLEVPNEN